MCVWSSNQELESHCEISTCSILPRNEWNFSIGHVLFRKPQISGLTTDKIPRIASELNFDRIEFLIQASKIREFILKKNLHRFTSSIGRIKRSFVPQYRNEINEICTPNCRRVDSGETYEIIPGPQSLFWVFLYRPRRQFSISFLASHAATFFLFSIYILSSSFVASVRSRNLWRHVFVLDTRPLTSRQITVLPLLLRTKPFSTKSFLL